MRFLLICFLSCLAFPSQAQQFDKFLPKFRHLYAKYCFSPIMSKQEVDHEAASVWAGSGGNYECAAITATQGVFETHWSIEPYVYGHRGHCGMRITTIIIEGRRIGLISKDHDDSKWLLKLCRKDPTLADKLAASRFVYLLKVCKTEQRALRTWVRGSLKYQNERDQKDSLNYSTGVLALKKKMF